MGQISIKQVLQACVLWGEETVGESFSVWLMGALKESYPSTGAKTSMTMNGGI